MLLRSGEKLCFLGRFKGDPALQRLLAIVHFIAMPPSEYVPESRDSESVTSDASTPYSIDSTIGSSLFSVFRRARSIADQLRAVENDDSPIPTNIKEMTNIGLGRRQFVPEKRLYRKRAHTSWIREHGEWVIEVGDDGVTPIGTFWVCKAKQSCQLYFAADVTTSASDHLNAKHCIFAPGVEVPNKKARLHPA